MIFKNNFMGIFLDLLEIRLKFISEFDVVYWRLYPK